MADSPPPQPSVGTTLRLRLDRDHPLTPAEHRAVSALGARAEARAWRHAREVSVQSLDGPGPAVACLSFAYSAPDLDLIELPELARLLDAALAAVPGARPALHDPAALFVRADAGVALRGTSRGADARRLPPLAPGWRPDPSCVLARPADLAVPPHAPALPPPSTEGQLADLLHVVARVGLDDPVRKAAAGPAVRHVDHLTGLLAQPTLPSAAAALLTELALRGLADVRAAEPAAEALLLTGDRRERRAARELLATLRPTTGLEHTDAWQPAAPPDDPEAVALLGARLLARPSLQVDAEASPQEWEDDLLGDDLVLLDPDAEVPESPVLQALRALDAGDDLDALAALADRPGFAASALAALEGPAAAVAGACLLLGTGRWPHAAAPGLARRLVAIAEGERPWPERAAALFALARSRRADLVPPLQALLADPEPAVAQAAVRALGLLPGAAARRAVRAALDDRRLAAHAVAAAGDAGDPGAFLPAVALADHPDPEVRRAVARHLDRIGGPRAIPALQTLRRTDDSWQVQIEAAGGLARQASPIELRDLLSTPDSDLLARLVRALGEADRADAFGLLVQAATHARSPVREAAAASMGALRLGAATPHLVAMLRDANPDVRIAAVEALAWCGDARAVPALRDLAARDDDAGVAARRALRAGLRLRLPPADSRVRVRALSATPLLPDQRERIRSDLGTAGLGVAANEGGFEATGAVQPGDLAGLRRVAMALERLRTALPGLRWSVRDGASLLRQLGEGWGLSATRGRVLRDAGWFEEALPTRAERPDLTPLQAAEPVFSPLPVQVQRRIQGREQVRMTVDPARAADPDEITGEVPARPDDEAYRDVETIEAAPPQPRRSSPRAVRSAPPSEWDDLLSEARSADALARIAARGLQDGERDQLRTWLASGLPGIQVAACRVAAATAETGAVGPIAALAGHADLRVRLAVAEALGALRRRGDGAAEEALQALAQDTDPTVQSAATRGLRGPARGDEE